jgi:hypothetical protein
MPRLAAERRVRWAARAWFDAVVSRLNEIEDLAPEERSSQIGRRGVFEELGEMEPAAGLAWLERSIASPEVTGTHSLQSGNLQ